jgi:hypothetical protein
MESPADLKEAGEQMGRVRLAETSGAEDGEVVLEVMDETVVEIDALEGRRSVDEREEVVEVPIEQQIEDDVLVELDVLFTRPGRRLSGREPRSHRVGQSLGTRRQRRKVRILRDLDTGMPDTIAGHELRTERRSFVLDALGQERVGGHQPGIGAGQSTLRRRQ